MSDNDSTLPHPKQPASNAHIFYRIPTAPNTNRVLELFHDRSPVLIDHVWPGASKDFCRIDIEPSVNAIEIGEGNRSNFAHTDHRNPLPFSDSSFDLIVLHRTLDDLTTSAQQCGVSFDASVFMERIVRVLVPGGLLVGCVDNRTSIKTVTRWVRRKTGNVAKATAHFSLGELHNLLSAEHFNDAHLFTLLPNCDDPLRLIDVDSKVSKIAFRHEIESARSSYSRLGYFARQIAVELGLYPYLEESFFFWVYKRC